LDIYLKRNPWEHPHGSFSPPCWDEHHGFLTLTWNAIRNDVHQFKNTKILESHTVIAASAAHALQISHEHDLIHTRGKPPTTTAWCRKIRNLFEAHLDLVHNPGISDEDFFRFQGDWDYNQAVHIDLLAAIWDKLSLLNRGPMRNCLCPLHSRIYSATVDASFVHPELTSGGAINPWSSAAPGAV
jgi:hypothetical protein